MLLQEIAERFPSRKYFEPSGTPGRPCRACAARERSVAVRSLLLLRQAENFLAKSLPPVLQQKQPALTVILPAPVLLYEFHRID